MVAVQHYTEQHAEVTSLWCSTSVSRGLTSSTCRLKPPLLSCFHLHAQINLLCSQSLQMDLHFPGAKVRADASTGRWVLLRI